MSGHNELEKQLANKVVPSLPGPEDAPQQSVKEQLLVALRRSKRALQENWQHIWLIYSLFMFLPLFYPHDAKLGPSLAIVYPVFLFLYFGAWHAPTKNKKRLFLLGLFLLGSCYVHYNNGAIGIFIYVASILPFLLDRYVFWLLVGESAWIFAEAQIFQSGTWMWASTIPFCMIIGVNNIRIVQRIRDNAKLKLAQDEVENLAKLAERERIARDLHDVLGHTLSLIVLKSELAQRLQEQNPIRAQQEMRDVEQTARQALADVRQAISGYRSEGVTAELDRARRMLDAAGITFRCETPAGRLSAIQEAVLSLIVREAVTNIVRHSKAKECSIRMNKERGTAMIEINDDGCGKIKTEGNGIRGMRERIEALGGKFEMVSESGTQLKITIPNSNRALR